ncbi:MULTISPECIES: FGGY-family carbohydrate kinase [unclassified Thermosynechococcus]|uniref:FGGY-family carbohydrate kinase n=1 Tax=unclassified Thermosynechococcus TaxID=2622553 RepID=UPI002673C3EF|nr:MULTISPECIES: FGGY-family carbohydrate kinase [unclassified Thermosynechococcus]MDR5638479.1 FGGY-family carbohydrate kinase [Thermosynechococcus sp. PP42]WKT81795.1 FGGY-family carbohydrate kinase [Thermosynechococcus sp. PP45]WNC25408.1 FGGY-family carbohydrate kinase [Thermosynechococcus sp. PP551]WNC27986.1 FGGY-family carbohydrate kinase [Thermosynechococcus sp. PP555]WNC30553.1 FGGY-family carbohydrate kinase [Thermosynechococcus sp. PKX82]
MAVIALGIDFGTSGARAIAIDPEGKILATARRPLHQPDRPQEWAATLRALILDIPSAIRQQIQRIAIDATSSTVFLCDAQGQPCSPVLLYNDDRAQDQVQTLRQILTTDHLVLSATSSLVKLLWLQTHYPTVNAVLVHQADWLAFLLHGQLGISDWHNALKLGYDPAKEAYPDWFSHPTLASLQPLLPKVIPPGTVLGKVTATDLGLSLECEVCAGTTDSIAAFLASGASEVGEAVTSLGSTLVLKLLSASRVEDLAAGIYSHRLGDRSSRAVGDRWLVGGASNCGAAILAQFFTPAELERLSAQIDVNQPTGLDYYPLLKRGERFPINDPHLEPRLEPRPDDPRLFLQGLLESLSRIEAQGYQQLQRLGASPLKRVWTAGGGARNPAWLALRQQYLGVPVAVSPQTEAAYGAARLAQAGLNFN